MGRRRSLSVEPVRTSARLIPLSLPVNVASTATMVLLVTRGLWQFQVVRGGPLCCQGLYGPIALVETLPRPGMRTASCSVKAFGVSSGRAPFWFKPISIFGLLEVTTVVREFTSIDHTTQS
jgi:hypothetical protein